MKKTASASETPATVFLKKHGVPFVPLTYQYMEHGGAMHGAQALGLDPSVVVKTLLMQDQAGQPLVVLMHGNCNISTKNLARQIGAKTVELCQPAVAQRYSGYLVGGTSPFGLRRAMPVYIEETILAAQQIFINGGRRGLLLKISPQICVQLLHAKAVQCALEKQA